MTKEIINTQENSSGMLALAEKAMMSPDVDVAKMQAILNIQEQIYDKNSKIEFNRDMSLMQSGIPCIEKNGAITVNNQVRSRYAKFEDIMFVVKPIMTEYGFSVLFKINTTDSVNITGVLMHKSGHEVETSMKLPIDTSGSKNCVQSLGSSVQYGKRYVLCALLNISTTDDDDGVVAGGGPEKIIAANAKKEVVAYMVKYMDCLRENMDAVLALRGHMNDPDEISIEDAAASWYDMSQDDQTMLYGLAPTKGGFLTTAERDFLKGSEFATANRANIAART